MTATWINLVASEHEHDDEGKMADECVNKLGGKSVSVSASVSVSVFVCVCLSISVCPKKDKFGVGQKKKKKKIANRNIIYRQKAPDANFKWQNLLNSGLKTKKWMKNIEICI